MDDLRERTEDAISLLDRLQQERVEAIAVLAGVINGGSAEWHEAVLFLQAQGQWVAANGSRVDGEGE